jgi:hypothetical protein
MSVLRILAIAAIATVMVTGCSAGSEGTVGKSVPDTTTATPTSSAPETGPPPNPPPTDGTTPDLPHLPFGDGLQTTEVGLTFKASTSSLEPGQQTAYSFRIVDSQGKSFTTFLPEQTKLMHLYLVRSDLTAFQHVHPAMSTDGTWTATLQRLQPGAYRAYAVFTAYDSGGDQISLVLGDTFTVAGAASTVALPPPSPTTQVDGYTVTVTASPMTAGKPVNATITISKDGAPVTNLQPYLGSYADVVAAHEGDLAFAYFIPQDRVSGVLEGPSISFRGAPTEAGNWRLFVQFQIDGALHTAALTMGVGHIPLGRWL